MKFYSLLLSIPFIVGCVKGQDRVITAVKKDGNERNFTLDDIDQYLKSPFYNPKAKIVIYIYAILPITTSVFTEYQDHLPIVIQAYQTLRDNFLYVDFDSYGKDMSTEIPKINSDAEFLTSIISNLLEKGVKNIELVGFSMGGPIGGLVAKNLKQKNDFRIPTIVALEPVKVPEIEVLSSDDADFVMTVRTEYRFHDPTVQGDVNFFFNKQLKMPQCVHPRFGLYDHRCGQERAQLIWAEAVKSQNPKIFPGIRCESLEKFNVDECENDVAFMNPFISRSLKGNFFVETTDEKDGPFHKDLAPKEL